MGRGEDRITYLPDPILQIILSMIPLKSAVRTDVLSKKWRNLWKFSVSKATSLEFDEDFASNLSAKDFVETVNRYVSLNDSEKLERFSIFFCPFELFYSDIERWISFALSKEVRHLSIDLSQGFTDLEEGEFTDHRYSYKLPPSLFDCNTLIKLSLGRCYFPTPLNFGNLFGLQSLSLSHCDIDGEILQGILTGCHLLESLSLRSCKEIEFIRITNPDLKLKRLTVGDCHSNSILEIDAPKLQSFHYFGELCRDDNFMDVSSLVDASIHSIGWNSDHNYMEILTKISSHVKILTLCTATLVHLNQREVSQPNNFPIHFTALKELQLLMPSMIDEDLTCFFTFSYLCSFPILEKLFIKLPQHLEDPSEIKYGVTLKLYPPSLDICPLNHLSVIKVKNFKGSLNEMRMVSFLLQKAKVLKTLSLVLPSGASKDENGKERLILKILRGQLSLLKKRSRRAQITIHEFGEDDDGFTPTHEEIFNDDGCLPVIPCMITGTQDTVKCDQN